MLLVPSPSPGFWEGVACFQGDAIQAVFQIRDSAGDRRRIVMAKRLGAFSLLLEVRKAFFIPLLGAFVNRIGAQETHYEAIVRQARVIICKLPRKNWRGLRVRVAVVQSMPAGELRSYVLDSCVGELLPNWRHFDNYGLRRQEYDVVMAWLWRIPAFIAVSAWAIYLYSTPGAKVSEHTSKLLAWWRARRGR
jgi:hypothetical protein